MKSVLSNTITIKVLNNSIFSTKCFYSNKSKYISKNIDNNKFINPVISIQ